jgi:hypothetical protein
MGDTENTKEQPAAPAPTPAKAPKPATPTPTPVKEEAPKASEPSKLAEPDLMESIPFANWLATGKTWGTSFVQTAKDKTLSTIELVKKDFDEFSDTVSKEATAIASATTDVVKSQAQLFHQFVTTPDGDDDVEDLRTEEEKKEFADLEAKKEHQKTSVPNSSSFGMGWMKSLVDTVQKYTVEDTTKDEHLFTEKIQYGPIRNAVLDQYELSQIQNDERTFLCPPEKHMKLYEEWLEGFKISEYNGEINTLLGNNPRLRELYAKVVPSELDNHTFWDRYFFKVYNAEQEKLQKQKQFEINVKSKDDKKSPSDNSEHEKDETWSMCSSTHDQLNELPDEVSDAEPHGPITPRATIDAPDGWENFDSPAGEHSPTEKSTSNA